MPLIELANIRDIKPLSLNSNIERNANAIIEESEYHDVRPLLGTKLYQDLIRNEAEPHYAALLNGGEYTFQDFTYNNPSLIRVLVEFAYARILFFGNEVSTPFGVVKKHYDDATPITRDRSKELYKAQQSIALEYWIEVKHFLNRNTADYEYWDDCDNVRRNNNTFKLTHIT